MNSAVTLSYYDENAKEFCENTVNADVAPQREMFLKYLEDGAYILDFGCGSGRDTKAFLDLGYRVDAVDGSLELCKTASEYTGIKVKNMLFQDLDEVGKYDGIWACSSILHVSKEELKIVLKKMLTALKDGGVIYTSFKYGDFEGERNGRYFSDFTEESFTEFIADFIEESSVDFAEEAFTRCSVDRIDESPAECNADFKKESSAESKADCPQIVVAESWITGDVRPGRGAEKWLNLILKK
ncbi:MAG: class I SAM-dependent methyltransferase [Lachnospiraceae bacterium]|nr:class I SAM-dependent methyltransferase [Lachnospiraceae bacterium]